MLLTSFDDHKLLLSLSTPFYVGDVLAVKSQSQEHRAVPRRSACALGVGKEFWEKCLSASGGVALGACLPLREGLALGFVWS